ncbi:MAG: prolyl oligopeptidase family serine peptidase [Oscillospiraceae bacterium]|nr:prolyl oligopeptidase family serine peptidase [Oscillospiraceae bacterium]MBQ4544992.1 prolyl oligopeptidase family serine peptidase [Oscillospiraceae bacterium]
MNRIEHREDKWIFPFVEYSNITSDKKLPLIIQLHGAGERGLGKDDLDKVDVNGFSKVIKDKEPDCIVIMPQCPPDTFWAARVESIVKFIEQLIQEYNVDEDRVYLTGLSMGGYGTWFTAMARPDLFAAIAPVCGGGMAWNAEVLKMPIWTFHGAEDDVVSPYQTDEMVAKLKELNADVTYTRIDGVGHNVWENAYNEKLFEWLLSKKRK